MHDERGQEAGWYLYYFHPNMTKVLQLVAFPAYEDAVVAALLAEIAGRGALAATGRTDVALLPALAKHRCTFNAGDPWSLVLNAEPAIRMALQGRNAFFTRLEGEWW